MNSYANEFSVSINPATDEVVLIFRQNLPTFKESGDFDHEKKEIVASLVMPSRCASALGDALIKMPMNGSASPAQPEEA